MREPQTPHARFEGGSLVRRLAVCFVTFSFYCEFCFELVLTSLWYTTFSISIEELEVANAKKENDSKLA